MQLQYRQTVIKFVNLMFGTPYRLDCSDQELQNIQNSIKSIGSNVTLEELDKSIGENIEQGFSEEHQLLNLQETLEELNL